MRTKVVEKATENRSAFLSVTMRPSDRERVSAAASADNRSDSAWSEMVILAELDRLGGRRKKTA